MASASELTLVEGFSAPLYAAMSPYITALPSFTTTINVNTAEPLVLAALHPNLDEVAVENLMLERPWSNIEDFHASLEREAGFLSTEDAKAALSYSPPVQQDQQGGSNDNGEDGGTSGGTSSGFELVSVQSNYFLLTVVVQLGTNMMQLESLLYRAGAGSDVVVLERTIRFLPKTAGAAATAGADEEELESTTTDS
jgi:type II secretory pathway component PulK